MTWPTSAARRASHWRRIFPKNRFNYATTVPYGMKASMAHDLERGNRLELDWLAGHVVELGRKLGVKTPANTGVYTALKLLCMGKPA